MEGKVSLWRLFGVFSKIGAFTIGGGYAMIPVVGREMTDRGWMREDEFEDVVILAQSAPGLLAVNMAIYAGYRLRGTRGSIVATLGAVLPSFLAIILIAGVLANFKDNEVVRRIFQGVRPTVIALILVPAIRLARRGNKTWWMWALTILTIALVAFLKFSPLWIIIAVMALSAGVTLLAEGKKR